MPPVRPTAFALAALMALAPLISATAAQQSRTEPRIVAGVNVRLRTGPSLDASIITMLPLGTSLIAWDGNQPRDTSWVRVEVMPDATPGYIHRALTRLVLPRGRVATLEALAIERLARKHDDISWRMEIFEMLTRTRAEALATQGTRMFEAETTGRLALLWVRSLRSLAASIPPRRAEEEPYRSWLYRNDSLVVYNEPSGGWLARNDMLWRLHEAHMATSSADEIAWQVRENGIGADCEGYVLCYLTAIGKLDVEYLRRHPRGAHAAEGVGRIAQLLEDVLKSLQPPFDSSFLPRADCPQVVTTGEAWAAIVRATQVPERMRALAAIERMVGRCVVGSRVGG